MKHFYLALVLILVSCGSGNMLKTYTEENNAIPPDFGKEGTVLLLIKNNSIFNYNHFLNNAFKKNYHGNFELIEEDEINKLPYNNKEKYRYTFDFSYGTGYTSTYQNGHSGNFKRYYVYDRLIDKKFIKVAEFSAYAKAMKAYAINLENKRKQINNIK